MQQVHLLNIEVHNLTMIELLEKLRLGGIVFTPNVDHLIKLQTDYEFYRAYQCADYKICDSKVLAYASHFLGTPVREKISGSDLFPAFYAYYQNDPDVKIFLLGAAPGVAERARQRINAKVGREMVVGAHSPSFGFEQDEAECQAIVDLINQSGATVLAVGVGAPKQEKWIAQYRDQLFHVKTLFAIGATIDFEAGSLSRSPKWMSDVGLEWLFRMVCEPKRLWRRYLVHDLPFFWYVLQQRFKRYRNPWAGELSVLPSQTRTLVSSVPQGAQRDLKRPNDALCR
jgi:exopolysaccharide biosynthesis WecB/TagA/CpsF family protein